MDYEKAYKDALERAKGKIKDCGDNEGRKRMIRDIFPELRESEDEKTRKAIVATIEQCPDDFLNPKNRDRMLAYLEKQKVTPMPNSTELIEMWHKVKAILKEKDFRGDEWRLAQNAFMDGFARGTCVKFEKQKEQKPISSCDIVPYIDDKIAALQDMWREEKVAFDWDDMHEMIEDVARHFYQKEQKPAEWSDEDKDYYDTIVRKLEVIGDDSGLSNNQIKFLREHCPSHRSGWSEEDENKIESIKGLITTGRFADTNTIRAIWNLLDSLRPSWKPSEEQMKALGAAIVFHKNDPHIDMWRSLYDDLQKSR